MFKILIADDVPKIRDTLCDYFSAKGWQVSRAEDGEAAVALAAAEMPDLMILDVMMPKLDGLAACRAIRAFSNAPVVFLSALGEEEDLLAGYDRGGDDYIVKPVSLPVLLKKCEVLLSRSKGADGAHRLTCGALSAALDERSVYGEGVLLPVAGRNFDLLVLLMQHKGKVLSREQILARLWGYDFEGDARVVDTHIKQLRCALGKYRGYVRTVIGTGYSLREDAV
ncbi:MAG: response regulator transcription factor [Clostridia bacterium]|nr:response regulator transcription factor [Clostridia bacterium]